MPKKGETGSKYRKVKISNEKIRQRNKKEYAKIIVLAAFLLVITIGGSYALFQTTIKGNKQTEVVAGTLKVEYEDKNTISLNNASPLTDVEGLNQEPYTFTVRNIGTLNGKYTIYLEEKEGNTLDKSNIKYSIKEGEGDWSSPVLLSSGLVLKENRILEKGEEETYQIKMWLKEEATNEVQGQTYKAKVVVNVVQTNTENIVTTNPVIKLNGESVVKINQNDLYVDAGVSSVSSREEISLDKVKVRYEYNNGETTESVEEIDTSKVGIYYIYYEVEDSKGIKGVSTRVVNVVKKGTNTPTIVLKGEEELSLSYKEKYVEAGYEARDVEDGELTDKVVVEGVVNSEVAGTYIIKYIVIDSEGNTASVVRKVIVNRKSQGLTAIVNKEEEENISTTVTIEAETESEKAYYAVTTTDKKPGDSEYKELVNKKGSINIVKNGRYYIFIKDGKGNVVKKIIDITNIDETKPSCSFEDGGYVEKGKTKEIELTCTDPADIVTESIETERIEVSDSEVGEVESISVGEKIEKGYKYKVTVRGKDSGNFTIKLKGNSVLDKVGNKNEEVESTSVKVVSMDVGTPEIELDLTGTAEKQIEISGTNIGKLSYESNNKEIAIVTEEGIVKGVSPGVTTITVTEANGKITKEVKVKVVKTITVTFTKDEKGIKSIDKTTSSCVIEDEKVGCSVRLATITPETGYSEDGWYKGTEKIGTSGEEYNLEKEDTKEGKITLIAKATANKYTVTYDYATNGGSSATKTSATVEYGSAIDLTPTATKEGYTFVGWNTSKDASEGLKELKMGTSDVTLYAIFKDETKPKCSFGDSPIINYGQTGTISLTCIDSESGMNSQTLSTSNFTISSTTVGSIEAISSPKAVTNGYAYTITLKGLAAGNFTISLNESVISDKEGNKNVKTTSGNITVSKVAATLSCSNKTYTGTSQTGCSCSGGTIGGTSSAIDAGTYTASCSPDANHTAPANKSWSIGAKSVAVSWGSTTSFTYNGSAQAPSASATSGVSGETINVTRTTATSVGSYTSTASCSSVSGGRAKCSNYTLTGTTKAFSIDRASMTKPGSPSAKNYTGSSQSSGITCPSGSSAGGTTSATNAGTYTQTCSPDANHKWSDGTTTAISISWTISKINPTLTQSATSGSATTANTTSYTISSNVAGTYTASSGNTSYATVSLSTTTAVTANTKVTSTVKAVSVSSSAITITVTVTFNPTDTTNYNTVSKTYSFTPTARTYTLTFNSNGATLSTPSGCTASGNNRVCSCKTTGTATTCSVTSPVITAPTATPSVYGYSTSASTHSSSWDSNTTKTVSSNGTYYAQTYKSAVTYTAKWGSNGATLSSTADKTCTIGATYNGTSQGTSCTVTAPTITRSGFTIVGFNTNSGGTTSALSSGGTLTLTSSNNNSTWYAISSKSVVIKWDANNATISKTQDSCTIWNSATSCNITSPTISRTNYFIIGWNTSSSSTTSAWNTSTQKAVSSSATYYAITELATAVNVTGSTRTLYRSLDAAMKASTSSSTTTTLLKNTTENITISTAVTANVNLNSKTMTGLLDNNYASSNITLSGGTITNSNNRSINNKGKITINSGTYTSSSTAVGEAIQNVSGATLNINGGYISSTSTTTNAISNAGTLTMSNGTIESKNSNSGENGQYSTVYNEGTIKMSGGTIIQNGNSHSIRTKGNFSMSGGTLKLTLVGTSGTALINIGNGIVNTTGGTIESTGYGFVNRNGTNTLCTISNTTINITSATGYVNILNDQSSNTLSKNNTIYSVSTSGATFNNTSGTLVSYNDTLKSTQAILGVLYKYTVFGSGDVEVEVFGRSDITSFPTWSDANGQDDIKWYGATDYTNSLGTYKFVRIYASNHNNEKGTLYHTHIYAGSTFVYGFDYTMPA